MTLGITPIIAAAALATVAFAVPQQVMAYRHNHHNNNHIKVDQQINQAKLCAGQPQEWVMTTPPGSSTVCVNEGDNNTSINH